MEGPEEITTGPSTRRRSGGAARVVQILVFWLALGGLLAGLGWWVSASVQKGVARLDERIAESRTRTSVAYSVEAVRPVEPAEPVVAPGIGEPPRDPNERVEVATVVPPRWIAVPNPRYPMTGGAMVEGTVALHCVVTAEGRLDNCEVVEETPQGRGFGPAALAAAEDARLSPRTINDRPVAGEVRFSIRFHPG